MNLTATVGIAASVVAIISATWTRGRVELHPAIDRSLTATGSAQTELRRAIQKVLATRVL